MKISGLPVLALVLVAAQGWAQIYKSTDADGNVIFTDTPPPNTSSEQVQLQHTNTTPPPPNLPEVSDRSEEPEEEQELAAPRAIISSPADETTIPMGGGDFSVTAQVSPGLARGQSLRLLLDGEPQGENQPSGFWDLNNVFRGAHELEVQVLDTDGSILSTSDPITVYVMRPSVR